MEQVNRCRPRRDMQHRRWLVLVGDGQPTQQVRCPLRVQPLHEPRIVALPRQVQQDHVPQGAHPVDLHDRLERLDIGQMPGRSYKEW